MTPKANLHDKDEYVEFTVSTDLYSEPDKTNKQKLLKKGIITKVSLYLDDIIGHEEVFNNKGKLITTHCRIPHTTIGQIVVRQSYKKMSEMKAKQHANPEPTQLGFKK